MATVAIERAPDLLNAPLRQSLIATSIRSSGFASSQRTFVE